MASAPRDSSAGSPFSTSCQSPSNSSYPATENDPECSPASYQSIAWSPQCERGAGRSLANPSPRSLPPGSVCRVCQYVSVIRVLTCKLGTVKGGTMKGVNALGCGVPGVVVLRPGRPPA